MSARVIDELLVEHEGLANRPFAPFPKWVPWVRGTLSFMFEDMAERYGTGRLVRQLRRIQLSVSGAEEGVVRFSWKGRPIGPWREDGRF